MNEKTQDYTPALGFKFLTGLYDSLIRMFMPENSMRRLIGDVILPREGEHILEFGFGTGSNIISLLRRWPNTQLTGIDIDAKVRDIAARKIEKQGLGAKLDLYEGGTLPYDDGQFDAAFTLLVLHHLTSEAKTKALAEFYRVIKPGGRLIVGDFARPANIFLRIAFLLVQIVDGFKTTDDNLKDRLPGMIKGAKFVDLVERTSLNTLTGTIRYYCARRP